MEAALPPRLPLACSEGSDHHQAASSADNPLLLLEYYRRCWKLYSMNVASRFAEILRQTGQSRSLMPAASRSGCTTIVMTFNRRPCCPDPRRKSGRLNLSPHSVAKNDGLRRSDSLYSGRPRTDIGFRARSEIFGARRRSPALARAKSAGRLAPPPAIVLDTWLTAPATSTSTLVAPLYRRAYLFSQHRRSNSICCGCPATRPITPGGCHAAAPNAAAAARP
ncbi:hypothetical protein ACVWZR_002069 [Bradyrhizobium sp. i1.3.1]